MFELVFFKNYWHVIKDLKIYGSFKIEDEARVFFDSCCRQELRPLSPDEESRLFSFQELQKSEKTFEELQEEQKLKAPVNNDGFMPIYE